MSESVTIIPANKRLLVSPSPHAHSGASVPAIMRDVIVALLPACAVALILFGWDALRLLLACSLACMATEYLCRFIMKRENTLRDWSALLTGILLALNLPPGLPTWQAVLGSVVAIAVAKQVFGGLGYNPFNPALIGRAFLLISFTATMTTWSASNWSGVDALATATPLGVAKDCIKAGAVLPFEWSRSITGKLFIGNVNGCIGETSALALMLGGLWLMIRRVITWHVPVSYIGTVLLIAILHRIIQPEIALPVGVHLFAGGLFLGAFFMATDMVTTPITRKGLLIFGVGCGILTMILRIVPSGSYPEGVSFAILIMNAFTPLINRVSRPRRFGAPVEPASKKA